ncbi:probable ureide permease A3 isoform X2 [Glycine soja]|uniref:Putative ureide permease A3 isoform B n=2 Tax=Glycine soja TaxID=3848 RepID=A0A445LNG4_GLYSO|nr:probable ureide permease A3 isoform X2 [Glycine soja]RZC24527.1 putative ureide permease A3 isoform B [Glycine soja]
MASKEFSGLCSLAPSLSESILCTTGLKMYMLESKGGAIACMFLSLFFLGTWPALLTMLERRGRLPQHTYLDYSITNFLAALLIAFTLGGIGKGTHDQPNFLVQLAQDNWPSVLFAMGGGLFLSLGNLSCQYAFAFVGLSVTEVITASITVVIGTTLNYFLDDKINKAEILFPGVGCFLIAVFLGSAVHSSNAADNKAKLSNFTGDYKNGDTSLKDGDIVKSKDLEGGSSSADNVEAGTAVFLMELEEKRAIKVFGKSTLIGLFLTFFAGLCFSMFSPAFNIATNDQWNTLRKGVPHLTVYTAFFYFSVSCFVIAMILNITFLYHPVLNLPKSSFKAYLADSDGRVWAMLAGLLCGFGNGLQFMGGQAAGYAAADAVQALPLVSTFWGVVLFGEYRKSSRRTYILLGSMLFMFIVAVAVLMASSGQRTSTAKE